MQVNTFTLAKAVVMLGIGFWLGLAVLNNATDMGTNLYFMKQMLTMSSIKPEPLLGKGVLWHALNSIVLPRVLMYVVICVESITAFLLLWSSVRLFRVAFGNTALFLGAISLSNVSLIAFFSIWIWFLDGDLWFDFWIKQGAFASVHSTWIIISLLLLIFINYKQIE